MSGERLERGSFSGVIETEQKNGGWQEALQNEVNLIKARDITRQLAQTSWWDPIRHHTAPANNLEIWW